MSLGHKYQHWEFLKILIQIQIGKAMVTAFTWYPTSPWGLYNALVCIPNLKFLIIKSDFGCKLPSRISWFSFQMRSTDANLRPMTL